MKLKNIVLSGCFLAAMCWIQESLACPAPLTCGPATVYEVTIQQIELCTGTSGTDCQGAAVIGSGTLTMDIASAAVGSQVASYGTVKNLQAGTTYTHVRVTVSTTFNINGTTSDPGNVGGSCVTNGGTGTVSSPLAIAHSQAQATSALAVPTVTAIGAPANMYSNQGIVHNSSTMTMVSALPTPVTITTSMPSMNIAFDTSEGLGSVDSNGGAAGGSCYLFPAPPTISITN